MRIYSFSEIVLFYWKRTTHCYTWHPSTHTGTIGVDFALKSLEWGHNSMVHLQLWDIAGTHTTHKPGPPKSPVSETC